jgi:hypothetical protein
MNRRRRIITALLAVIVISVFICCALPVLLPHRDATITFAGFRDYHGNTHALFWMTNGSCTAIWRLEKFSRKVGAEWVPEQPAEVWRHETILAQSPWKVYLTDDPGLITLIGVPVSTTSAPLRLSLSIQERSPGIVGLWEYACQIYRQRVLSQSVLVLNGKRYIVTNDGNL